MGMVFKPFMSEPGGALKAATLALLRWGRKTAWAPAGVLILHSIVSGTTWREPLDFWLHFFGGASIAFVMFSAVDCMSGLFGTMSRLAQYLLAFTSACTVGVFWEFAEFGLSVWRHAYIYMNARGTMSDLIADACGAVTGLAIIAVYRWFRPVDPVVAPQVRFAARPRTVPYSRPAPSGVGTTGRFRRQPTPRQPPR